MKIRDGDWMMERTKATGKPQEGLCWSSDILSSGGGSTVPLLVPFVPFCGLKYFTTSLSHVTSGKLFTGRDQWKESKRFL